MVARRAHNPKVVGSNPAPQPILSNTLSNSITFSTTIVNLFLPIDKNKKGDSHVYHLSLF